MRNPGWRKSKVLGSTRNAPAIRTTLVGFALGYTVNDLVEEEFVALLSLNDKVTECEPRGQLVQVALCCCTTWVKPAEGWVTESVWLFVPSVIMVTEPVFTVRPEGKPSWRSTTIG